MAEKEAEQHNKPTVPDAKGIAAARKHARELKAAQGGAAGDEVHGVGREIVTEADRAKIDKTARANAKRSVPPNLVEGGDDGGPKPFEGPAVYGVSHWEHVKTDDAPFGQTVDGERCSTRRETGNTNAFIEGV